VEFFSPIRVATPLLLAKSLRYSQRDSHPAISAKLLGNFLTQGCPIALKPITIQIGFLYYHCYPFTHYPQAKHFLGTLQYCIYANT